MIETRDESRRKPLTISLLPGVVLMLLASVLLFVFLQGPGTYPRPRKVMCMANLKSLGAALRQYAADNDGRYPLGAQWCDLLREAAVDPERFTCPNDKKGPCSYAMNPDADPNDTGDIVLLFESRPGWNLAGGAELLTTENHQGQGCCVLFTDGHIEFVKTEDVASLRWKPQDGDIAGP